MNVARITHMKALPKNVDFWDYYILCHVNNDVAAVLQRFEYWDSTKAGGNVHSEQINEQLQAIGKRPTQDTSRFVYKALDELAWEMSGRICERTLPKILDVLIEDLGYLKRRSNPINTFDHTKQYEFQERVVFAHLRKLYAIINHFHDLEREPRPVLYAIEQLTREGTYIAHLTRNEEGELVDDVSQPHLTINSVAEKLRAMHAQMQKEEELSRKNKKYRIALPRFIRADLRKDEAKGFGATSDLPSRFGKFAESSIPPDEPSNQQNCVNDDADLLNGSGNSACTIPVITPTVITNNDYTHTERPPGTQNEQSDNSPSSSSVCVPSNFTSDEPDEPGEDDAPSTDTSNRRDADCVSDQLDPSHPSTEHQKEIAQPIPIANGTTPPTDPPANQPGKGKKQEPPSPIMPTGKEGFTPETLLLVCEARQGRLYPNVGRYQKDHIRDQELAASHELYQLGADIWTDDAAANIALFCKLCEQQETRRESWWLNHHGHIKPHNLFEKDRLHAMYDEVMRQEALATAKKAEGDKGQEQSQEPPTHQRTVGISGLPVVPTRELRVLPVNRPAPMNRPAPKPKPKKEEKEEVHG